MQQSAVTFNAVALIVVAPVADLGNTKGGSIPVPSTFCLTGLESVV